MKIDPELKQETKKITIHVVIALFVVMIAICMGPIISLFMGSILSIKVTIAEATSYYIQAILATAITSVPFNYGQAKE